MDGTPRALALTSPKIDEREVCLQMVARCERQPGQTLILIRASPPSPPPSPSTTASGAPAAPSSIIPYTA